MNFVINWKKNGAEVRGRSSKSAGNSWKNQIRINWKNGAEVIGANQIMNWIHNLLIECDY